MRVLYRIHPVFAKDPRGLLAIGMTEPGNGSDKITIKFTNLFLSATKDSLIMVKKPAEISELLRILKDAGYEPIYRK